MTSTHAEEISERIEREAEAHGLTVIEYLGALLDLRRSLAVGYLNYGAGDQPGSPKREYLAGVGLLPRN